MQERTTTLTASDGKPLFVRSWLPDGVGGLAPRDEPARDSAPPRAVIQLVHGMAEHSGRYRRFATAAVARGIAVVADDHRGHGATIGSPDEQGHTADTDGWARVLEDLTHVREAINAAWPGVPVILMGHSWGSMLVRGWVARQSRSDTAADSDVALAGLIVMGAPADLGLLGRAGAVLARAEVRLRGPRHVSTGLDRVASGRWNASFEPRRTDVDWLSRDESEVDAFIADPLCGFVCTSAFFRDAAVGGTEVNRRAAFEAIPQGLPVLVVSGAADPVGDMGRGVRRVATAMRRAGVRDVTLRLYPDARHELLNETNRDQVTAELLTWVEEHLG